MSRRALSFRPALPFGPALATVRRWSAVPLALRLVLLGTGGAALALACGGELLGLPGVLAGVGVLGLLAAVPQPHGAGSAVVLGAAALAWTARYGSTPPPVAGTLLLAAVLALHHQVAALAAVLPVTARVEGRLLARFGRHLALVLALSGAVALLALAVARPRGSVPLELAGLAAAVLAAAVPVLLGRSRRR